ncbi:MAG: hypothetical protein R3A52_20670 [Polyangiales bacterium]
MEEGERIAALRARLLGAPGMAGEPVARVEALVHEAVPFVEAAMRAEGRELDDPAWTEARSMAWLLAYRMGDQGFAPLGLAAAVQAWREALSTEWASRACDDVQALLLDGFSRGREDRARHELQRGLAAALPVVQLGPKLVVAVAAGPLDADGAQAVAERAGQLMLRADAKAALLDLTGLADPDAAVMAELGAVANSARMLGAALVVSAPDAVAQRAKESGHFDEVEVRWAWDLGRGVEALLEVSGTTLGAAGFTAWLQRLRRAR